MRDRLRRLALPLAAAALAACGSGPDVSYRPTPQLLPSNIQRLALHPI